MMKDAIDKSKMDQLVAGGFSPRIADKLPFCSHSEG